MFPWVPPALLAIHRNRTNHPAAIAQRNAQFTLPALELTQRFPIAATAQVTMPVSQIVRRHLWAMPVNELLHLATLCHAAQPRRVFEIGTYTGASTLVMALNTPPETALMTLDIDPAERATHQHGLGTGGFPDFTIGAAFQDTPAAGKIQQLLGSSRGFDFTPYHGSIDLVFVDADHTYEFVKADTATAFKLLRPGGMIIWDDYRWDLRSPECAGVTRCLNELAQSKPVFQLAGTRFAIYIDDRPRA